MVALSQNIIAIMIVLLLFQRMNMKGCSLMNYENYIKDIKRLNQRIVQVAKSYGKESPLYMEYETKLKKIFPSEQINVNKRGEIQLSRSKQFYNTTSGEYVQRVQKTTRTVSELRKQARESIKVEIPKGEKITEEMIKQRIKDRWEVEENLQSALDSLYGREDEMAQKAIETMRKKGEKSHEELKSVIDQSKNGNAIVIRNLFEGL